MFYKNLQSLIKKFCNIKKLKLKLRVHHDNPCKNKIYFFSQRNQKKIILIKIYNLCNKIN